MRYASLFRTPASRCAALLVLTALIAATASGKAPDGIENRCGWFVNPSPGNASLLDRDGEWTVAMQGGHQAEGNWPSIDKKQWVAYGGTGYGYGCTCMRVVTDAEEDTIKRIVSSQSKPLLQCRRDPKLTEPRL